APTSVPAGFRRRTKPSALQKPNWPSFASDWTTREDRSDVRGVYAVLARRVACPAMRRAQKAEYMTAPNQLPITPKATCQPGAVHTRRRLNVIALRRGAMGSPKAPSLGAQLSFLSRKS